MLNQSLTNNRICVIFLNIWNNSEANQVGKSQGKEGGKKEEGKIRPVGKKMRKLMLEHRR